MKEAIKGRSSGPAEHANTGMPPSTAALVPTPGDGGRLQPERTGPRGAASPTGS
jgi:hypothetical protein